MKSATSISAASRPPSARPHRRAAEEQAPSAPTSATERGAPYWNDQTSRLSRRRRAQNGPSARQSRRRGRARTTQRHARRFPRSGDESDRPSAASTERRVPGVKPGTRASARMARSNCVAAIPARHRRGSATVSEREAPQSDARAVRHDCRTRGSTMARQVRREMPAAGQIAPKRAAGDEQHVACDSASNINRRAPAGRDDLHVSDPLKRPPITMP